MNVTNGGSINAASLVVGDHSRAQGEVNVLSGGAITTSETRIGDGAIGQVGGEGTVVIQDPGSTWNSTSSFRVGRTGPGTLTVTNQAVVSSPNFAVGRYGGANGTPGANGTLLISAGGKVASQNGWVAQEAGSIGTVTVTGNGSRWDNSNDLNIGAFVGTTGQGVVRVENGAIVTASRNLVLGSRGQLDLIGGSLTVGGGTADSTPNTMRLRGTAVVTLGNGTVTVGNGPTETADNTLRIRPLGRLVGRGTINGIVANSGLVSPGDTIGWMTIAGGFIQGTSGTLAVEIGGTNPLTQYDRLSISGPVTLAGTLDVAFVNSFVPAFGASFQVMSFTGRTGEFDDVILPNLPVGRLWSVNYGNQAVTLSVTALGGDINLDGSVDRRDMATFASHFDRTTGVVWQTGDFNADGRVNLADLAIMQSHWGESAATLSQASLGAAVAEPSSLTLLALGVAVCLVQCCCRYRNGPRH